MTGADLRAHAHAIADAFHIRLNERDDFPILDAHAHDPGETGGLEVVCARTITDERTYAIVMHEFGHILHPGGRLRDHYNADSHGLKCEEEYAAWAWAEKFALGGWTATMEEVKRFGLESYERARRAA